MSVARGGDLGFELEFALAPVLVLVVVGAWTAVRDELGEMDVAVALPVLRLALRSATLTPVLTADLPLDSPSRPGEVAEAVVAFSVVAKGGVSLSAPPLPL